MTKVAVIKSIHKCHEENMAKQAARAASGVPINRTTFRVTPIYEFLYSNHVLLIKHPAFCVDISDKVFHQALVLYLSSACWYYPRLDRPILQTSEVYQLITPRPASPSFIVSTATVDVITLAFEISYRASSNHYSQPPQVIVDQNLKCPSPCPHTHHRASGPFRYSLSRASSSSISIRPPHSNQHAFYSISSPPSDTPLPEIKTYPHPPGIRMTSRHFETILRCKSLQSVLIDQAVKTFGKIWRPQDIPSAFLTISRSTIPSGPQEHLTNSLISLSPLPSPGFRKQLGLKHKIGSLRGRYVSLNGTATPVSALSSPILCLRRAFLASVILASKFTQDKCYLNCPWVKLPVLSAREISGSERSLGETLDWRLWVGKIPVQSSLESSTPAGSTAGNRQAVVSYVDGLSQSPSSDISPELLTLLNGVSSGDRTIQMSILINKPMAMYSAPQDPIAADFWPGSDIDLHLPPSPSSTLKSCTLLTQDENPERCEEYRNKPRLLTEDFIHYLNNEGQPESLTPALRFDLRCLLAGVHQQASNPSLVPFTLPSPGGAQIKVQGGQLASTSNYAMYLELPLRIYILFLRSIIIISRRRPLIMVTPCSKQLMSSMRLRSFCSVQFSAAAYYESTSYFLRFPQAGFAVIKHAKQLRVFARNHARVLIITINSALLTDSSLRELTISSGFLSSPFCFRFDLGRRRRMALLTGAS
ncbi:hypothetical protein NP233_g9489 [Leucocoprinus birnbaumii]|uniref:Uncharacterized protein n=1 Tax=Leucocoprinus birnbaumii TaxID=56174 RepID=A0AAD5YM64_9AGAR|nr:hypothetical protein NP233_g9489 [Leucocoprinus birnbaumii]